MHWTSFASRVIKGFLRRWDLRIVRGESLWRSISQLHRQPIPNPSATAERPSEPFIKNYAGAAVGRMQIPFDFAVVMPSILRPTISDAIESVFAQDFAGRVQLLIGVDRPAGDAQTIDQICRIVPSRHAVTMFYPGYSTSRRHGGLHPSWDGGALRTILSYLANSRYLAYLDDDNWYAPSHLTSLHGAIQGFDWAYALRWFVHPRSRQPICVDRWESVGPTPRGTMVDPAGWVDPNCFAIDKFACEAVLRWWGIPRRNTDRAMDADRNVFDILSTEFRGRGTGEATIFYALDESDRHRHPFRLQMIGAERYASAAVLNPGKPREQATCSLEVPALAPEDGEG